MTQRLGDVTSDHADINVTINGLPAKDGIWELDKDHPIMSVSINGKIFEIPEREDQVMLLLALFPETGTSSGSEGAVWFGNANPEGISLSKTMMYNPIQLWEFYKGPMRLVGTIQSGISFQDCYDGIGYDEWETLGFIVATDQTPPDDMPDDYSSPTAEMPAWFSNSLLGASIVTTALVVVVSVLRR